MANEPTPPPAAETVLTEPAVPAPSVPPTVTLDEAVRQLADEKAGHATTQKEKKDREIRIAELEDTVRTLRAVQSERPSVPKVGKAAGWGYF